MRFVEKKKIKQKQMGGFQHGAVPFLITFIWGIQNIIQYFYFSPFDSTIMRHLLTTMGKYNFVNTRTKENKRKGIMYCGWIIWAKKRKLFAMLILSCHVFFVFISHPFSMLSSLFVEILFIYLLVI